MSRRTSALLIPLALLTACGGGGGKGGALPPTTNSPQTEKTGTATFGFKLPGKTAMSKMRWPLYQSQGTQGVAIDWSSTDPTHPDYSSVVAAVCPATLPPGVIACTIDSQGNTDYTFQLQIPAGTYSKFTVSTFDAAPINGKFTSNMLAQGQLAAPVVIVAGQSNTIPNLTFYGIPAAVNFQPAPAQSHVVNVPGGYGVIGNAPQTFFAQAVDADGYAISSNDSGAPVLTVSESASDTPQSFAIAPGSNAYTFTVRAIAAPFDDNASINVAASPPAATGLAAVNKAVAVTAIPEMWFSTTGEGGVIFGYALSQNSAFPFQPGAAVDAIVVSNFIPFVIAVDNFGNIWSTDGGNTIYSYSAGVGTSPPALTSTTITSGLQAVVGLAVDGNNTLWVADQSAPDDNGEVVAYNISNPSSPSQIANDTILGSSNSTIENPQALAVAPNSTSLVSAARNTVWVSSSTNQGTVDVLTPGNGSTPIADTYPGLATGLTDIGAIAVGTNGTIWLSDISGSQQTLGYTFAPATLTQTITTDLSPASTTGLATDPTGALWVAYNNPTLSYVGTNGSVNGSLSSLNSWNAARVVIVP